MSTRSSHRLALVAASLLVAAGAGPVGVGAARASGTGVADAVGGPPNIVLIQADDQTLGQFTAKVMPNTKRLLADTGRRFATTSPPPAQCCPSRASLITGQYAHNDGVTSNGVGYRGLVDKGNVLPGVAAAGGLSDHPRRASS